MADERTKLEIIMAAVGTLAGSEIVRALFTRAVTNATERIKREVFHDTPDCRAEIIQDLMTMPDAETQNFWTRYRKARTELQDNRIAKLIGKVALDPNEGRKPVIRWLNELAGRSDDSFDLALAFLEDNHFMEGVARVWQNTGRITERDLEAIGASISGATKKFDEAVLGPVARWIKRYAEGGRRG
jgi:hypothetical protein